MMFCDSIIVCMESGTGRLTRDSGIAERESVGPSCRILIILTRFSLACLIMSNDHG